MKKVMSYDKINYITTIYIKQVNTIEKINKYCKEH